MNWTATAINPFIALVLLALFAGCLCGMLLKHLLKQEEIPPVAVINALVTAAFLQLYGFSANALQYALFTIILLFASVYDLKTHTIPDYVHFLILMAGLICFEPIPALLGAVLVPLPFFIAALCKSNSIGGGDIKLMAACGFLLGVTAGFTALLLGLLMAVLFNAAFNHAKKPVALAPYLAFGCLMACLPA